MTKWDYHNWYVYNVLQKRSHHFEGKRLCLWKLSIFSTKIWKCNLFCLFTGHKGFNSMCKLHKGMFTNCLTCLRYWGKNNNLVTCKSNIALYKHICNNYMQLNSAELKIQKFYKEVCIFVVGKIHKHDRDLLFTKLYL